jgi:hypothetical protein
MPFAPITVNTKTFTQAGDGRYMRNTVTFGNPSDYFTIKGGSRSRDGSVFTAAITRVLEKDVLQNGITSRRAMSVQVIISVPPFGFTSADADSLALDISEFLTVATVDRLMAGES